MYANLKSALLHVYINFTFPFSDITILYFIYLPLHTQQKHFTNILFKKESNWKIKTSYFYSHTSNNAPSSEHLYSDFTHITY